MSKEALDLLFRYDWPGNVRELINVIEYAFVLCHEGEIMPNHLPARVTGEQSRVTPRRVAKRHSHDDERKLILEALEATGGNQSKAAEILGISRVTLWKRLKAFDIQVDRKVRG